MRNKAVYLALGMTTEGVKEVLGIWVEQNEGAKFWLKVMNELRHRGVEDILIAVVDGLKGFPEAITSVFPEANVQTCIVHLIRHSLSFCGWKERQKVAAELKKVYRAENAEAALQRLAEFENGPWGKKFPMIAASWKRNWEQVIPFFAYGPEPKRSGDKLSGGQPRRGEAEPNQIRRMIYTTNAIESIHMQLRKVLKNRGHFPSDESAVNLIHLALRNITKKWNRPPVTWKAAVGQFAIQFGDRFFSSARVVRQSECILWRHWWPRLTFSRISEALAVHMKGLGTSLWAAICCSIAVVTSFTL